MELFSQAIAIPSPERLAGWVANQDFSCWLDSALPGHPRSRYSLLALEPLARLTVDAAGAGILEQEGTRSAVADPWSFLSETLRAHVLPAERHPFFSGGWIGFLAYESYGSRGKQQPRGRVPGLPDAVFLAVDTALVMDHEQDRAWVFSLGLKRLGEAGGRALAEKKIRRMMNRLAAPPPPWTPRDISGRIVSNQTREEYLAKVEVVREAIGRGDCYQVNLSQQFSVQGDLDPADVYLKLRAASPAPQMSFLNLGTFQILSASPEVLLGMDGDRVVSHPIKGTRPRLDKASADARMRDELLASSKDAAELLMIVDLVRNDLGQFCRPGTVRVPSLKTLESFPQVHHLVATVEGLMRADADAWTALRLVSPGGSITGAPKLKAMEIIDALEPGPRGIYTGSVGYADFSRRASFNIAIRTAFLANGKLCYAAGGGITYDSDAAREYDETLHKAEGWFRALGLTPAINT